MTIHACASCGAALSGLVCSQCATTHRSCTACGMRMRAEDTRCPHCAAESEPLRSWLDPGSEPTRVVPPRVVQTRVVPTVAVSSSPPAPPTAAMPATRWWDDGGPGEPDRDGPVGAPRRTGAWVAVGLAGLVLVVGLVMLLAMRSGGDDDERADDTTAMTLPANVPSSTPASASSAPTATPPPATQPATTAPPTTAAPTTAAPTTMAPTTVAPTTPPAPAATLTQYAASLGAEGSVGPIAMPDGTEVGVITVPGPDPLAGGQVHMVMRRGADWVIQETFDAGIVTAPEAIGDVTGDGRTEIVVRQIAPTGGGDSDLVYRLNSNGPTMYEIPFDIDSAQRRWGLAVVSVHVDSVSPGMVQTTVVACRPSCADDPGTPPSWQLDRAGNWSFVAA